MEGKIQWGKLTADFTMDWIESLLIGGGLGIGVGLSAILATI